MKLSTLLYPFMLVLFSASVYAESAAVIDDFECMGFVPDGAGGSLGNIYTTDSNKVLTKKGVRILTCHFDHRFQLQQATGAQGFLCGIFLEDGTEELTSDTKLLATPGGRALLECRINGKSSSFHDNK